MATSLRDRADSLYGSNIRCDTVPRATNNKNKTHDRLIWRRRTRQEFVIVSHQTNTCHAILGGAESFDDAMTRSRVSTVHETRTFA
jgi:hypothetical protein